MVGNLLMGGIAHTIKTEGGYRPQSNFIIEQSRKADREGRNGSCEHDNGERLQRVCQSSDECGNGSPPPLRNRADGITLNRSKNFERPPLPNLSRTLDTSTNNGVVEWKNK